MVEGAYFTLPRPLYATLNLGKGEKKARKTGTETNKRHLPVRILLNTTSI